MPTGEICDFPEDVDFTTPTDILDCILTEQAEWFEDRTRCPISGYENYNPQIEFRFDIYKPGAEKSTEVIINYLNELS